MTSREVAVAAATVVIGVVVMLAVATVLVRAIRLLREERRMRLRDELRPVIVAVLSAPDAPLSAAIPRRRGREQLFEILAFDYLAKVKGEAKGALVRLLVERGTVDAAERRLRRPGVVGRSAAAELLGRCELARSRVPLEGLLAHRSASLRAVAMRALGRIGDAEAMEPMLGTLRDHRRVPPAIVTQAAVHVGPPGIPALERATSDPDGAVRSVAITALGLQRAVDAVPALLGALDDTDITVRGRAARALGEIGDPRAVDPLVRSARADPANDGITATALGELGDRRAIAALVELVDDGRHDVATAAARALTRCGPDGLAALRRLAAGRGLPSRHAVAALAEAELPGR